MDRGETGEGHSFRMGVMRTVKRERVMTVKRITSKHLITV